MSDYGEKGRISAAIIVDAKNMGSFARGLQVFAYLADGIIAIDESFYRGADRAPRSIRYA
jgi:hypothetical protein